MQQEAVTQPLQKETMQREPIVIKEAAGEKAPEKIFEYQDSRTKHELILQLKEYAQKAHRHLQKEDITQDHEKISYWLVLKKLSLKQITLNNFYKKNLQQNFLKLYTTK